MIDSERCGGFPASILFCCLMLMSLVAFANQKRCPVCHEVFDTHVDVCLNDGTNLKLLGEELPGSEGDESDPSDKQPNDAIGEKQPEDGSDNAGDNAQTGTGKYIRQDKGGRRRRAVEAGGTDGDERTDRLRRLHDSRAGVVVMKKRESQSVFSVEKDTALREKYRFLRDQMLASEAAQTETVIVVEPDSEVGKSLWEQAAPIMSIGPRFSWISEARNPGPVSGAEIDLNLLRSNIRVGLSSFIGVRHVDRNELIFLESVSIGVQRPWRFAPFLTGRFGIGAIVSHRFGREVTNLVRGIGFDAGVDCHVTDAFVVSPVVGYIRYGILDAVWDSVALKLSVGF